MPTSTQPRFWKRVRGLLDNGLRVKALSYQREYLPPDNTPLPVEFLGSIPHGEYARRLITLWRSSAHVCSRMASSDVVYAFGLDMAMLALCAMRRGGIHRPLVCEVGDIRPAQTSGGIVGAAVRAFDKCVVRRVGLLVVTSEDYATEYYRGYLGQRDLRYIVIENKAEAGGGGARPAEDEPLPPTGAVRIGYYGLLRCPRSWAVLRRTAIEGAGRVHVAVRGLPLGADHLAAEAPSTPFVEHGGPYVAPRDLPGLYAAVDLVWACYPYSERPTGNWRWARTNRFYEACYYGKPMLTLAGSADARVVEALGVGRSIDLRDIDVAVRQVLDVRWGHIAEWRRNLDRVPSGVYCYTDEHERLAAALAELVDPRC